MDGFPVMGLPDSGDTAWMLISAALVLLMTPGLAFFYGGMVRARGVLNMIMMSVSAMGVVTVLWVLYGYSFAFGNDKFGFIGDPGQYFGLKGLIGGNAVAEVIADPVAGIEAIEAVTIPLADKSECEVLFWGDAEWDRLEADDLRRWVFQPSGVASPARVLLRTEAVEIEVSFDALTGEVIRERIDFLSTQP